MNFPRLQDSIKDEQFVQHSEEVLSHGTDSDSKGLTGNGSGIGVVILSYAACNRLPIDEKTQTSCAHAGIVSDREVIPALLGKGFKTLNTHAPRVAL